MNEFIIRNFFRIVKINNNSSGYGEELRSRFVRQYQEYQQVTIQNMIDRKNYILNEHRTKRPLSQHLIDRIKHEVDNESTNTNESPTTNENVETIEQINNINTETTRRNTQETSNHENISQEINAGSITMNTEEPNNQQSRNQETHKTSRKSLN